MALIIAAAVSWLLQGTELADWGAGGYRRRLTAAGVITLAASAGWIALVFASARAPRPLVELLFERVRSGTARSRGEVSLALDLLGVPHESPRLEPDERFVSWEAFEALFHGVVEERVRREARRVHACNAVAATLAIVVVTRSPLGTVVGLAIGFGALALARVRSFPLSRSVRRGIGEAVEDEIRTAARAAGPYR